MRVKLLVEQGEPFNSMIIVTFGMLSCHQDVNEAASKYTGTMGIGQDRPIPANHQDATATPDENQVGQL